MTRLPSADREPVTTDGTIAVANLHAQISGLAAWARRAGAGQGTRLAVATQAVLIDLTSKSSSSCSALTKSMPSLLFSLPLWSTAGPTR